MNKKNQCGGIFNSGKCILTKEEGKLLSLNIKSKRILCKGGTNEFGECNYILKKRD